MAIKSTNTTPPIPPTTVPGAKPRPSWAGGPTPTPTPTVPKAVTTKPITTTVPGAKPRPSWAGGAGSTSTKTTSKGAIRSVSSTQDISSSDAKIDAQNARLDALNVGVPEETLTEVDKGLIASVFGAGNSILNFKIPGTKIRPVYLPFYPVDKILEIEQIIPGIINQIQNAQEGKPVDVGSFKDPFGDKGIIRELGRTVQNVPRKTELFQGMQEQRGFSEVVDNKALALALDIFAAPTTYLSGGGVGISKGFLSSLTKGAIRKSITETGEALTKAGAKKLAAEKTLNLAKAQADEVAKAGVVVGPDAKRAAEIAVTKAESNLAKRTAAVAAEEANPELLFKNAEDFARSRGPRRTYGARTREDIGATVVEVAESAAKTLDDYNKGLIQLSPTQLKRIQTIDNVLSSPNVLDDIINKGYGGMRGAVGEALYTKGGFRLGVGKIKTPVFAEKVSDILGTGLSTIRIGSGRPLTGATGLASFFETGFSRSAAGSALVEWTTNLGKRGLAGEADIPLLRSQLRTGQLTGDAAKSAVKILSTDRTYRRALAEVTQNLDYVVSPAFARAGDRVFVKTVEDLIVDPRINLFNTTVGGVDIVADSAEIVSRKLGRTVTEEELNFAKRYSTSLNSLYDTANDVYREIQQLSGVKVVKDLPKTRNFFPHVISDKTREFLRRTSSKEFDELMGYDRTLLGQLSTPRRLTAGTKIGNYTLTATDIAGGTKRLNQILKQQKGIDFDWFATDAAEALSNQVDNVASDIAFLSLIRNELRAGGKGLVKTAELEDVAGKPFIGDFVKDIESTLTPQAISIINTVPEAKTILDDLVDGLVGTNETISTTATPLLADEVESVISNIRQMADDLSRFADDISPSLAAVTSVEASALADLISLEARGIKSAIEFKPITDFTKVKSIVDDGFAELNRTVFPGVQAQKELVALLQNYRRLEDPKFLRAFNKYLGWYNRTFKGWVTATPGFHVRNAYSNGFFMLSAGADMGNVLEAGEIYNKYINFVKAQRQGARIAAEEGFGVNPLLIDEFLDSAYPEIGTQFGLNQRERIRTALENVGVAGFGRVEEVFEGAGRQGFRGLGVTGTTARNRASEIFGTPLAVSRAAGQTIENYTRFALTYDGVMKGLSPESAAARTAKYLIDYSDISKADQILKQIIPFWMWISRSAPLLTEIVTTNPRAYILYKKTSNALRDEEGESDYIPVWMQSQGAFKAPFNLGGSSYLMPDLGLTSLSEDLGSITTPGGFLAALNPAIKTPLEYWLNYDAFRKEQIANKEFDPEADAKLRSYLTKNITVLGPVLQRYGRAGAAAAEILNADTVAEFIRDATRTGTPAFLEETEGITEPTMSQNITTLSGFLGAPLRNLEPYQERREAERRTKEYDALRRLQEKRLGLR